MRLTAGDLTDGSVWARRSEDIDGAFASIRSTGGPVHVAAEESGNTKGSYWALTRHADIAEVSRRPKDFSSAKGTSVDDIPPDLLERTASFIAMDDPRHTRLRRIVSRGFTPASLDRLRSDVVAIASELVADVAERGSCDFVEEVAATLPARVIMDLMGIPRSEEAMILRSANRILGAYEPEYVSDQTDAGRLKARMEALNDLGAIARELAADRVKHPRDDLVTVLVAEGVGEEVMTPDEMSAFFILLVEAGSETTRNAIAHGMLALSENPDQRARWQADFEGLAPTAIEEILRWATPVLHMRRTVTADGVRLGDVELSKGEKVVMWYYGANRDPDKFVDPLQFDISRTPNDHLSFGGAGVHFCLGAHLARREITVAFQELFKQLPDIEVAGPAEWLSSSFLNGIKHLPVEFKPASGRG